MTVFQKPRDHPIAEHMSPPELGHVIIQAHQIRQAAAQDDGIGVENIDDLPQRARQTMFVTAQRRFASLIARRRTRINLVWRQILAGDLRMISLQSRPR